MTFLGLKPCFFALFLLSAAQAINLLDPQDPTCTLQGSTSEDVCDSTNAADGSSCVWCTVAAYGLCVDADQAEIIEQSIPIADCGGGGNDDDDDAPPDNDDDVPDDYWTCLKDSSDKDSCEASGCAWCDTKGGYGVCMDKKAAESANTGDWFTCDLADDTTFFVDFVDHEDYLSDPLDTSCLAATVQMDEDVCKATKDQNGQSCEWCTIGGSTIMCLNGEQADIATQLGGSCDDTATTTTTDVTSPSDPYDMSCLAASVDKEGCFATKDADDLVCEWCAVGAAQLCLSHLQGDIAAQIGASCEIPQDEEDELEVSDPLDPSCLSATVQMDADACKATNDQDGQPCEWCTVGSTPLCLNSEQADIAEQLGGSCDTTDVLDPYSMDEDVSDPLDTSCLEQTLQMDEDACKAAQDGEGQSCEWCTVGSTPLCLNPEQADIASQLGGSCDAIMTESEVTDPLDPSCLAATAQMDEDVCKDTKDQDGQSCEWCTVGSTPLCLNGEQAQIAEQLGGTCDALDAPYDASCLKNSFNEEACHGKTDGDGNPCQWCSLPMFGTACLNPAQSQAFTQLGGHCEDPIEMSISIHIDLASA